jgi:site-specific DNA recombinase
MNGITRVALYARVSSQKQAHEKTIDSQCQAIRERITEDQFSLSEDNVFCDDGFSGSDLMRPALEKLRDRLAASLIDRLYVHSPDRLARKMAHQALLLEEFSKHDCQVIFLSQAGLPDSPEANMLIQMQGVIAEYEREKILERTRRGRRHAATQGNVSVFAGAPYGYRYIRKSAAERHARWEIDSDQAAHVKLMFELVGDKGFSLGAVKRELARRLISTLTHKTHWDCATIRGILINPAYHGEARYGRQRLAPRKPGKRAKRGDPEVPRQAKVMVSTEVSEQIPISVPAIIDRDLFDRVAFTMDENRKRQRERQSGGKYLLSGLVICGSCGSAYCSRRSPNPKCTYYRCIGTDKYRRAGLAICENTSVKGIELERLVWDELCKLLRDPKRLQAEIERRRDEQSQPSSQLQDLQREVRHLRSRLDRLIDGFESGLIARDEFQDRIGPLRERHDREAAALASLQGHLHDSADTVAAEHALCRLAEEVQSQLEYADWTLKRDLLKLLIKRVEIHTSEVRIVYKVPTDPFVPSPGSRGFLQHRLQRAVAASRQGAARLS